MKKIIAVIVSLFASLVLVVGIAAPTNAAPSAAVGTSSLQNIRTGDPTGTYNWYKSVNHWCNSGHKISISNYDYLMGWPTYIGQRYHFKMNYDDNPWFRPKHLYIDGQLFGDYSTSFRSGTLYDGFLNFYDVQNHYFTMVWRYADDSTYTCSLGWY